MARKLVLLPLAAFVTACLLGAASPLAHEPHSKSQKTVRREVQRKIADFTLRDQNGHPFDLRSLKGRPVIVSFIYTTCPDVCPLITFNLRQLQRELSPPERHSPFFVSVTTDPEVDEPLVLRTYAERFRIDFANWVFLTGGREQLASVWKEFGVNVERKARGLVNHTTLTALLDGDAVMRFAYHGSAPDPKMVLQDLHTLLHSKE